MILLFKLYIHGITPTFAYVFADIVNIHFVNKRNNYYGDYQTKLSSSKNTNRKYNNKKNGKSQINL